jgi:hypothetical protein
MRLAWGFSLSWLRNWRECSSAGSRTSQSLAGRGSGRRRAARTRFPSRLSSNSSERSVVSCRSFAGGELGGIWERLVHALCVASGVNARRRTGWAGPIRMSFFFFFLLFPFFVNFEILGEIKKCSDSKILFWKTVQIKTCSIRNLFNFEFYVQIRK